VAHLELTAEEAARYKAIPVVYNEEVVSHVHYLSQTKLSFQQGFCFEPRLIRNYDGKDRWIIKLCDEFPGYTRFLEKQPFGANNPVKVSVPRSHSAHPTDTVPEEGMKRLRRVVEVMLPEFAKREFVKSYMCWCTGECAVGNKDLL
jgi:sarcosine oxidase/L-pipecolate oxidase